MRQAIVLQNDALFLMFEKPFDKTEDGVSRAFVVVKEIGKDFAGPIDLFCQVSGLSDTRVVIYI